MSCHTLYYRYSFIFKENKSGNERNEHFGYLSFFDFKNISHNICI